jgi:DNA-binding PadR family transcriptional regulator
MLGEFEYLILSAATRLREGAYGAAIREEIEAATRRGCSIGALYTTLDRLEAKGLIKTWMGDPTPQRGGRPKRMVRVTANGVHAARDFYVAGEASKPRCVMGGKPSLGRIMTRICWWLVDVLSRMIDADERQAVRGDLAESAESAARAIRDVLDLIVRRQLGLWAGWQPWLALLGIACLAGVPLSRIAFRLNVDLGQQLMAHYKYGVHFGTLLPPQQDIAFLLCLAVALIVWSWTCGFALGSLSGRAVWLTWSAFYLIHADSISQQVQDCKRHPYAGHTEHPKPQPTPHKPVTNDFGHATGTRKRMEPH